MLLFVGLLCLPLDLWSLKCQKYFLYFPLMTATVQSQVGQNIYVYLKDLIKLSYKILCIIGSELPLARCQLLEKQGFGIFC